MACAVACAQGARPDTRNAFLRAACSADACQGQHALSPQVPKKIVEMSKVVQHDVDCLQQELQALIEKRLTSLMNIHRQMVMSLEEELKSGGQQSVHHSDEPNLSFERSTGIADTTALDQDEPKVSSEQSTAIADMKAAFHSVLCQDNAPDITSKKPTGTANMTSAFRAADNKDNLHVSSNKSSAISDMKAALHAVLHEGDVPNATSKKSSRMATIKAACHHEYDSSVDAATPRSTMNSPFPLSVKAGFSTDEVSDRISTSSVARTYKRPSRLQVLSLRKGRCKDEVSPKSCEELPTVHAMPSALCEAGLSGSLNTSPTTTFEQPTVRAVHSALGEAVLSASLYASQESRPRILDAPSDRVEATAFFSWKADCQDAPTIDWDVAIHSRKANDTAKEETALHRAVHALLESNKTHKSHCETVQQVDSEEHVLMHQSSTSSDGRRLESTTFFSWSKKGTASLEEAPLPQDEIKP